jgi:hypothetical protein
MKTILLTAVMLTVCLIVKGILLVFANFPAHF